MLDVYEWDYKNKVWKAFLTDDIQIEFSMLNPYYRLQMKLLDMNKPTYYVSFKVFKYTLIIYRHLIDGEFLSF